MTQNFKKRIFTSIFLFTILFLMIVNTYVAGYFLMIASIFCILEFFKMISIIFDKEKLKQLVINLCFIIYIFAFSSSFIILLGFIHLKILIFLILLTCVLSDIGGFVFGKIFKGPKLTKISPNKTIIGAIGSLVFSGIFITLGAYLLTKNIDPYIWIVGIITSVACQLGDLFISYLKRKSFLKDTGDFLPGHGGVLDRVDAMLLGIPIGIITLILIY